MDMRKLGRLGKREGRMSRGVGPATVVVALIFLGCLAGLGLIRFKVSNLAGRLNSINASITRYADEEARLKQELSAAVAPIKIYTYCKERLGMQKVLKAETLSIFPRQEQQVAQNSNTNSNQSGGWFASLAETFRSNSNSSSSSSSN